MLVVHSASTGGFVMPLIALLCFLPLVQLAHRRRQDLEFGGSICRTFSLWYIVLVIVFFPFLQLAFTRIQGLEFNGAIPENGRLVVFGAGLIISFYFASASITRIQGLEFGAVRQKG